MLGFTFFRFFRSFHLNDILFQTFRPLELKKIVTEINKKSKFSTPESIKKNQKSLIAEINKKIFVHK